MRNYFYFRLPFFTSLPSLKLLYGYSSRPVGYSVGNFIYSNYREGKMDCKGIKLCLFM